MPTVVGQDKSVYKRCTCRHCGSINEYTPNEVRTLWEVGITQVVPMVPKVSIAQDAVKKLL